MFEIWKHGRDPGTGRQRGRRRSAGRAWWVTLGGVVGLAAVIGTLPGAEPGQAEAADTLVIYSEQLADGWEDESRDSRVSFSGSPAHEGSRAISWRAEKAGATLSLESERGVQASGQSRLRFALRASKDDQDFAIAISDTSNDVLGERRLEDVGGSPRVGQWREYDIPLGKLDAEGELIGGISLKSLGPVGSVPVLIDQIRLTDTRADRPPAPAATPESEDPQDRDSGRGDRDSGREDRDSGREDRESRKGSKRPAKPSDGDSAEGPVARAAVAGEYDIYYDVLRSGWVNWSWGSSISFTSGPAFSGSRAISWKVNQAWGGLNLHSDQGVQTSSSSTLVFAMRASQPGQQFSVATYDGANQRTGVKRLADVGGNPPAGYWKLYTIPLSQLNAAGKLIKGVQFQDAGGTAQPLVLVDPIRLTATGSGGAGGGGAGGGGAAPPPSGGGCGGVPAYTEIRPENASRNNTLGRPANQNLSVSAAFRPYYQKINGNCTGTTEQILEWAANKWGFTDLGYRDIAKAMAVIETWWTASSVGDNGQSVGILQVKTTYWPDSAFAGQSTAYAADYGMAILRHIYDGASGLGEGGKGIRNAIGAYYCGCRWAGESYYANKIFEYYNNKPWRNPKTPPYWF